MSSQPNILLLVGEDTGRIAGCYGADYVPTPNLDRLAARGCRYDQAFTTSPVCAPSRSAIVTGQLPFKLGTHQMRSTLLNPPRLVTHELRDAGYYVTWPTKLDFNLEPTDGWADDQAPWLDRLRERAMPDQPWLAYVNLFITHESCLWPNVGEYEGREHLQHWETSQATDRPEQRPESVIDPATVPVPEYLPDTPVVRKDIARHADNLISLDRSVGEILDALEASGEADNTMIIFLADHGRGLPREKKWPYSAGIHLPLLVSWPGHIEPGSVSDRLISWIDIAPTLCSIAGIDIPEAYDGSAFLGEAEGPEHRYILAGRDRMGEAFDRVRVLRDKQFHYSRNFYPQIPYSQRCSYTENTATIQEMRKLDATGDLHGSAALFLARSKPIEELYDIRVDPECVHNLADDPEHREVRDAMAEILHQWLVAIDDQGAYPEREQIAQGMVSGRWIEEYRARREPMPEQFRLDFPPAVTEPADLERQGMLVGEQPLVR